MEPKDLYILQSADSDIILISDNLEYAIARFEWHVKSDPSADFVLARHVKMPNDREYRFLSIVKMAVGKKEVENVG